MEIRSKIFKIKCQKPTLDFLEDWFKKNSINAIRYAIVDFQKETLTLDVSYVSDI